MSLSISVFAPAKINLCLHVTGRRDDGYHELDSLAVFAGIGDRLTLEPLDEGDPPALTLTGEFAPAVPRDGGNLALKALCALAEYAGRKPSVHIRLEKRLPAGAGLGGGSADAAAVLRGVGALWDLPADTPGLRDLALGLGADVPVCLEGRPARLRGIGEDLMPLERWPPLAAVLIFPGVPLSTAEIFARCGSALTAPVPDPLPGAATLDEALNILSGCRNDLEEAASSVAPVIPEALAALARSAHCRLARMTGSGSSVFGIYPDLQAARAAAEAIQSRCGGRWWVRDCLLQGASDG